MRRKYLTQIGVFAVMALILSTVGCGGGIAIERADVTGKVTLDGQPLESGSVTFLPTKIKTGVPATAEIKNGVFSLTAENGATVGSNRVEITSIKKTGKVSNFDGIQTEETVQIIPAKFNSESELTTEVKAGANQPEFALTSK